MDLNFGPFAMPGKSQISVGTLTDKEKRHELSILAPGQEPFTTPTPMILALPSSPLRRRKEQQLDKAEKDNRNLKLC